MTTAGILLAAGRSERFGPGDKLLQDLAGRAIVTHAAEALRAVAPDLLIAVASSRKVAALLPGFRVVTPDPSGGDQSASLRAGIAAARASGATRALVVLGDMPLVTPDHLRAVLARAGTQGAAATTDGTRRMPPACFGAGRFDELLALAGDTGARTILAALPEDALVETSPDLLADVDRPADLQALAMNIGPPRQRGNP